MTTSVNPTRRTLVRGVAWSVPAIAVAGAAPAMAASIPPRGLNGWVQLEKRCDEARFNINGAGSYPDRGIWVFVNDPTATISGAEIIFYFADSTLTWTNSSGPGWTNLTRYAAGDGLAPAGFYAYRTSYSGGWTYNATDEVHVANNDPYWYRVLSGCPDSICAYARRTVTVNGETISFLRGPVCT